MWTQQNALAQKFQTQHEQRSSTYLDLDAAREVQAGHVLEPSVIHVPRAGLLTRRHYQHCQSATSKLGSCARHEFHEIPCPRPTHRPARHRYCERCQMALLKPGGSVQTMDVSISRGTLADELKGVSACHPHNISRCTQAASGCTCRRCWSCECRRPGTAAAPAPRI